MSRLTGLAASTVWRVRNGTAQTVRLTTSTRLLAAPPSVAPGALVSSYWPHRLVDGLEREHYTRREIAALLGRHCQQLALGVTHVRARTASRLAALHHQLLDT